ncbi:MAG TPA: GNAT family N-acetyltransferase [Burkholderiaceae bacterium]|jgi:GNAT superfamily N-acetyltransferase|nr:GNAT family N-acetyltransferase [Burkholderiaceae bacterium]
MSGPSAAVTIRVATMADADDIWRIRYAVTENTLTPGYITNEDVRESLEETGRGWVSTVDGAITGFAIGLAKNGHVWALFIDPPWQGRGHGGLLHDVMIAWLFEQGLDMLWLTTGSGTQARGFYESRGWQDRGAASEFEHRYELPRPQMA